MPPAPPRRAGPRAARPGSGPPTAPRRPAARRSAPPTPRRTAPGSPWSRDLVSGIENCREYWMKACTSPMLTAHRRPPAGRRPPRPARSSGWPTNIISGCIDPAVELRLGTRPRTARRSARRNTLRRLLLPRRTPSPARARWTSPRCAPFRLPGRAPLSARTAAATACPPARPTTNDSGTVTSATSARIQEILEHHRQHADDGEQRGWTELAHAHCWSVCADVVDVSFLGGG